MLSRGLSCRMSQGGTEARLPRWVGQRAVAGRSGDAQQPGSNGSGLRGAPDRRAECMHDRRVAGRKTY